jgi:hypothetical protein
MSISVVPGSVIVGVAGSAGSDAAVAWGAAYSAAGAQALAMACVGALGETDDGVALAVACEDLRTVGPRRLTDRVGRPVVEHAYSTDAFAGTV